MFAQGNIKRQKTARDVAKPGENPAENFQGIGRIEYSTDNSRASENLLNYRYYNSSERIHGRSMEDWLRPCVFLSSAFSPSTKNIQRPWSDGTQNVDNYKKGVRAMFELCIKLGVKFWAGYDRGFAPAGENVEDTNCNLEQVADLIYEYQQKTGIKPLWIGVDFKRSPWYENGAFTSSEASVIAYAGYQVKKALEIAQKLGAEHFLIPLSQEGCLHLLNTDILKEFKHLNRFLKLVVEQRDRIGYRGQILIDVLDRNDNDGDGTYFNSSYSALCFLKHFNLDRYFKLNVTSGHEYHTINMYNSVGSLMIRKQHLLNIERATLLLRSIVEKGGIFPGGFVFEIPDHNRSFESKDLVEAFITSIDCYAKALRLAVRFVNDVNLNKNIQMRYFSFSSGWGAKFDGSEATSLEECEVQVKKLLENRAQLSSTAARYEHWSSVLNRAINFYEQ